MIITLKGDILFTGDHEGNINKFDLNKNILLKQW